jgi:hypothetical protein
MRRATISFRMAISACAMYGFSRNYTLLIPGKAVAEADRRVANFRCFCKCSHGHTHINKINIMQLLQLKRNGSITLGSQQVARCRSFCLMVFIQSSKWTGVPHRKFFPPEFHTGIYQHVLYQFIFFHFSDGWFKKHTGTSKFPFRALNLYLYN